MVAITPQDPKKKNTASRTDSKEGDDHMKVDAQNIDDAKQAAEGAVDGEDGDANQDPATGLRNGGDGKKGNLRCAFTNDSPLDKDFYQMLRTKLPTMIWAGSKPPSAPPFLAEDAEISDAWMTQANAFALKMLTVFCPLVSRMDIALGAYDVSHFGIPRALALFDGDDRSEWECLIGTNLGHGRVRRLRRRCVNCELTAFLSYSNTG